MKRVLKFVPLPLAAAIVGLLLMLPATTQSAPTPATHVASGWQIVKFPQPQPACTGVGLRFSFYWDRQDCGFGYVRVSGTSTAAGLNRSVVKVKFFDSTGAQRGPEQTATARTADDAWQYNIRPDATWVAGEATIRVSSVDPDGAGAQPAVTGNFGEMTFFLNQLGATIDPAPRPGGGKYRPGENVRVTGSLYELDDRPLGLTGLLTTQKTNKPGKYQLLVRLSNGTTRGPYPSASTFYTANKGGPGLIDETLPGAATSGLTATKETNFETSVSIEVVNARYTTAEGPTDPTLLLVGPWAAKRAGAGNLVLSVPQLNGITLENSFVSDVGWVKPGESYTFRVFVRNYANRYFYGGQVRIPAPPGVVFHQATTTTGGGHAWISQNQVYFNLNFTGKATAAGPYVHTMVVLARARTRIEDPQIVWKNLSTTATLTYPDQAGVTRTLTSSSHGPKVIPPNRTYETARYGDRPFPVVPVDYFDRKHLANHTGDKLSDKINSPSIPGSTYNLYQEMSYKQLFPIGTVPSAGIGTSGFNPAAQFKRPDYKSGYKFTTLQPSGTCHGATFGGNGPVGPGSPSYSERIHDGWYQMPGQLDYYGDDKTGSALAGAVLGLGLLFDIDSACGPTGKAVYDAAHIADPEIDYSDYDTDKDGVVDFFMMVFAGEGGNGVSQTSVPPSDNIWPHSSSLEFYYTDSATGLKGYISDDQLKDLQGRPLYYTNASRTQTTLTNTGIPVYVRVGPYNVNPETAIDRASVISHEYGHSLGLPDWYSTGGRETYGDWNLMATDKSQHMDVNAKQELGWLIPRVLSDTTGTKAVSGWRDSKLNTKRIDWKQENGTAYALTGPSVNNGQGYVAKLPARFIIDPAKVTTAQGASPPRLWWSQSGNDFGCAPGAGHNLDVYLPELEDVAPGTPVTVTFSSYWDIEWDYDYGFVMTSTDQGINYKSYPSEKGFTTPSSTNPNANSCQAQYGNGITGTSGSYQNGTEATDRLLGNYPQSNNPVFLQDEYDLTDTAGKQTVLRFSYATDPGLARPGWFIDNLKVTVGSGAAAKVIYESTFPSPEEERLYPGGCKERQRVAAQCTGGWENVDVAGGSPADHAYYMELRDRSGFDNTGRGENDRDAIAFLPGLLLVYTDEAHCYGNTGCDNPPGQSPLDSQPQPLNDTPNLNDAAWTAASGDSVFSDFYDPATCKPPASTATKCGWTDNYSDPQNANDPDTPGNETNDDPRYAPTEEEWRFTYNCLQFAVNSMSGNTTFSDTAFDLMANATFTIGSGCGKFDYGYAGAGADPAPPPPPPRDPTVTLTKTGPTTAARGSTITYAITYKNLGPYESSKAKIVDTLPAQLGFVSASNGGTYNVGTRTVTWNRGTVPVGATGTVTLRASILLTTPAQTAIVNRAQFHGALTVSPPTAAWTTTVT
ncbi:MAG: immune inhibitor A domain-containing protein [Gaiellaceae bacterium]